MNRLGSEARLICIGFQRWKQPHLAPILKTLFQQVIFVRSAAHAGAFAPTSIDTLLRWSASPPDGTLQLANVTGAATIRMEDGFIRSVGLGSDLVPPLSLVLDRQGIYFDPRTPSDLEVILAKSDFPEDLLSRAQSIRSFIVEHGITKYNLEPRNTPQWPSGDKTVVLVPGQVEDDASIRFGCSSVNSNAKLLKAAREAEPHAFIVYKPHPDVISGNRRGRLALKEARYWADHIESGLSVSSCIEGCDVLHTMTSLAGFDALLRNKRVVTYGQPFYAGWGLTIDREQGGAALQRRQRVLTLDELIAGTLVLYPLYWNSGTNMSTDCENVMQQIVEQRNALEASGSLEKHRTGLLRRQIRKGLRLLRAWLAPVS